MDSPTNSGSSNHNQLLATLSFVIGLIGLVIYYFLDIKIQKKKKDKPKIPPDAEPDKSMITCDAIGCSTTNPSTRCGQCKLVYYCGKSCQTQHWKYHKTDCLRVSQKIHPGLERNQIDLEKVPDDATCAICLGTAAELKHPIALKACRHVFCYPCLKQYEEYSVAMPSRDPDNTTAKTVCPLCRTEMEETARETVLAKALLYAARASKPGVSQAEKDKACQLALDQMKTLGKPESDQDILQANTVCGHLATIRGDYKDALRIWEQNERIWTKLVNRKKQVDALLAKGKALGEQSDQDEEGKTETYQQMQQIQNEIFDLMAQGGLAQDADLINCRLESIQVRIDMEEWETAKDLYQQIMTDYPEQSMMTPPQQRRVFMGFARCLYEEGNYDGSIALGEAALEMNRQFPGIHKYVALSYKETGDWKQAQDVMARAVWYEAPWDADHREEARKLWVELMQEE